MHEPEVQHLEVAQASVNELARPARRARGPVLGLYQPYRETAAGRVQGRPGPGYASPDNEHVEGLVPQAGEVAGPSRRRQPTGRLDPAGTRRALVQRAPPRAAGDMSRLGWQRRLGRCQAATAVSIPWQATSADKGKEPFQ